MRLHSHFRVRALVLLATLAVLSFTAVNARAQGYAIEMIVFANLDSDDRASESWRTDPGMPDTSRAAPVSAGGVTALGSSAYRLSGIWQVLRNSSQYRPLRHLAWTQPAASARSAPEVLIGEDVNAQVYGTVRVSRSRFLHLDLDLLLRDDQGSYRVINHRRMRSNELHYIDHPLFGVLVIATPL